eukprot:scaffold183_cov108-Isochrysis_galbana.AAC.3
MPKPMVKHRVITNHVLMSEIIRTRMMRSTPTSRLTPSCSIKRTHMSRAEMAYSDWQMSIMSSRTAWLMPSAPNDGWPKECAIDNPPMLGGLSLKKARSK